MFYQKQHAVWVQHIGFLKTERGQEARGSSLRVCENIPAKSGWLNDWKLSQRPPHSLGLPHLFARVVTLNASSLCEAPRTVVHTPRRETWRKTWTAEETRRLTMKPVFVLLVSAAWTLTGAQYYYQGLMDYLENRLLAIEVSKTPLIYY